MIVNDEDLLPLGKAAPKAAQRAATADAHAESDFFLSSVAETFDSVDLLLAARAEAEEAEAKAKTLPETALPFARDDRKGAKKAETPRAGADGLQRGFQAGGAAADADSPAPVGAFGDDVRRLSDATGADDDSALGEFLKTESTTDSRTRYLEAHGLASAPPSDGLLGGVQPAPAPEVEIHALANVHIDDLLRRTVKAGASDLHLTAALPPMVRKDGRLVPLDYDVATERDTQRIVYDILNNESIEKFERSKELDFFVWSQGRRAVPLQRLPAAWVRGLRHARHPEHHPHNGPAQAAAGDAGDDAQARRTGSGDGSHGLGQVHHHRVHD